MIGVFGIHGFTNFHACRYRVQPAVALYPTSMVVASIHYILHDLARPKVLKVALDWSSSRVGSAHRVGIASF